jgi:multiple sugar transport system permease protein
MVTGRRLTLSREKHQQRVAYLFLTPWLVGLAGMVIGPILYSLFLSFTRYNLLSAPRWVGFRNFVDLVHDPQFILAASVTLHFVVVSVPLVMLVSLSLALFLRKGMRFLRLYRTLFYLPSLIGTSVAVAVLWLKVFGSPGLLNAALALVGISGPSWIGNPKTSLYTIVALNLWAFGSTMVIFLAGVGQVPKDHYEAAQMEGAGWWRCLWHVTLPWISPLVFFTLILNTIAAFQNFTGAYVISGGSGNPAGSLLFYSIYLYIQGFANFRMGYASAMAWVMFITLSAF